MSSENERISEEESEPKEGGGIQAEGTGGERSALGGSSGPTILVRKGYRLKTNNIQELAEHCYALAEEEDAADQAIGKWARGEGHMIATGVIR